MKAPAKLVCLETYWNEKLFESYSVKPFFEGLAPLVSPPLKVAHRFVESAQGLAYYARRPDGVMWRQADRDNWVNSPASPRIRLVEECLR